MRVAVHVLLLQPVVTWQLMPRLLLVLELLAAATFLLLLLLLLWQSRCALQRLPLDILSDAMLQSGPATTTAAGTSGLRSRAQLREEASKVGACCCCCCGDCGTLLVPNALGSCSPIAMPPPCNLYLHGLSKSTRASASQPRRVSTCLNSHSSRWRVALQCGQVWTSATETHECCCCRLC